MKVGNSNNKINNLLSKNYNLFNKKSKYSISPKSNIIRKKNGKYTLINNFISK